MCGFLISWGILNKKCKLIYLNGDNHLNNQTEIINVKNKFKKEIK